MSLVCTIRDGRNKIVKYRLIDFDTLRVRDLDYCTAMDMHREYVIQEFKPKKFKSINTKIEDYPYIRESNIKDFNKLIAIGEIRYKDRQVGYRACNYFGDIIDISNDLLRVRRISKVLLNTDSIANNLIELSEESNIGSINSLTNKTIELKESNNKKRIKLKCLEGVIEASVELGKEQIMWIDNIEVYKRYRGKHVGTLLYKKIEEIAREIGNIKEIRVGIDSMISVLFFRSLNFDIVDYIEDNSNKPESSIWKKRVWE